MEFIETTIFTRQVLELFSDGEYRELQLSLAGRPDQGNIIKGSGGFEKFGLPLKARVKVAE